MKITFDLDRVRSAFEQKHPEKKQNIADFAAEFGLSHTALYNWKRGVNLEKLIPVILMMHKTGLTFNEIFDYELPND